MLHRYGRRRFLSVAMGAGASLGLGAVGVGGFRLTRRLRTGVAAPLTDGLTAVTRTSWALGSDISITVAHSQVAAAEQAIESAFTQLKLVDSLMSIYRPESQVSRLNQGQLLLEPHPCLVALLQDARSLSQRTNGAFDVTVQPLWIAYSEAKKAGELPSPHEIDKALEKVDWRQLDISPRRVQLRGSGGQITLNGIAQGFAADRVMESLRQHGVEHALVNTGEIGTLGGKAKSQPWTIGIQHPRQTNAYLSVVRLDGRCIATSGDYATTFSADYRDHHIFDPRLGRSPQYFSSVSVAARTATAADALSTAAFVLGPEKGLELIRATPEADALLAFKDGTLLATDNFPSCA